MILKTDVSTCFTGLAHYCLFSLSKFNVTLTLQPAFGGNPRSTIPVIAFEQYILW